MPTESEVMKFAEMSIFQKDRLFRSDPQRYKELKEELDRLFPVDCGSLQSEVELKEVKK